MNKEASIPTNRSAPYHRCSMFVCSKPLASPYPCGLVHLSPLQCEPGQGGGGIEAIGVCYACIVQ